VTLHKDLDPAIGDIDLHPQEITRVLLNLFGNGFYAARERQRSAREPGFEPTLSVITQAVGDRVEIHVRDNGTGIPEAARAKIFDPFFTTKPAGEGTGLGLSLSHDIVVKQHGGAFDVETEPGGFTEFIVTLPRAMMPVAEAGRGGGA
jgi:signal transduction histidine kinase